MNLNLVGFQSGLSLRERNSSQIFAMPLTVRSAHHYLSPVADVEATACGGVEAAALQVEYCWRLCLRSTG